jgi:hypothetical protein
MTDKLLGNNRFNASEPEVRVDSPTEIHVPVSDPRDVWKDEKQPWASTAQGRLMIRAFSRGIMGAAFYSVGGHIAANGLVGYNKDAPQGAVQHLASFFDKFAGRPIEKVFGKDAVTFRPTLSTGARTLGEEVVDTTFNFACATAGDAIGRNIVGMFDPHCESKWRDENGKISFPKTVKSLASATGRVFEAQMADWFVSVPYVYQKRMQRNLIDKFSPGFAYDADRALNGSSFKLDEKGNIIGTYGVEGAIDLQARFTGYNIGTMMYYDGMSIIKDKVKEAFDKDSDRLKLKVPVTPSSMYNASTKGIANAIRYTLKSATKAFIIMTPSLPSFWMMRVTQFKDKGMGIMPDGKPLLDTEDANIRISRSNVSSRLAKTSDGTIIKNPFGVEGFDPYKKTYGIFDTAVNPFGRASFELTKKANAAAEKIATARGWDVDTAVDLSSRYINGAMAYTPYIYTKNEFSHRWNNKSMDNAIYRTIDGLFGFNAKEIKAGFQNIRQALRQKSPDTSTSHPETIPEDFDREAGEFVKKIGKKSDAKENGFAEKLQPASSWKEHLATSGSKEPSLTSR